MPKSVPTKSGPSGPTRGELIENGKVYIADAQILYDAGSYHNAFYLAGYAAEFWLKARIVKHMKWTVYRTGKDMQSFKRHDLDHLLSFTGLEKQIKNIAGQYFRDWQTVVTWNVELRYDSHRYKQADALAIIESVKSLRHLILK